MRIELSLSFRVISGVVSDSRRFQRTGCDVTRYLIQSGTFLRALLRGGKRRRPARKPFHSQRLLRCRFGLSRRRAAGNLGVNLRRRQAHQFERLLLGARSKLRRDLFSSWTDGPRRRFLCLRERRLRAIRRDGS